MLHRVIALSLASLISHAALASTVGTSKVSCKYIDSKSKLQVDTKCVVHYGFGPADSTEGFYQLNFPNGSKVDILLSGGINVTANQVPAQIISSENQIVVLTSESELFVFQNPL
jgi:hypothetical protein